ncbi:MAG: NUDIX hydrolase [Victivallales bacterium]|nr:NUDIX hydrolase [Victivallales bacterium]
MEAKVTSSTTIGQGRFLRLELKEYTTAQGKVCTWESAERNVSHSAALVIATMKQSGRIVLVRQFRPPLGAYSLEFPAGLIDPGEGIEETAARELREETGYSCRILWHTGECSTSPGMCSEMVAMVYAEIDESAPENIAHRQNLQDNEDIEVLLVAKDELSGVIRTALAKGDVICSRLAVWAAAQGARW